MKIVIDIPEGLFEAYKGRSPRLGDEGMDMIAQAIANGTPYEARPQGEIIKELWNCRNELCLKCERYKEAWNGACKDCRYNFENMERWKEDSDEVADDKHL
jgi:hypothetical protein